MFSRSVREDPGGALLERHSSSLTEFVKPSLGETWKKCLTHPSFQCGLRCFFVSSITPSNHCQNVKFRPGKLSCQQEGGGLELHNSRFPPFKCLATLIRVVGRSYTSPPFSSVSPRRSAVCDVTKSPIACPALLTTAFAWCFSPSFVFVPFSTCAGPTTHHL